MNENYKMPPMPEGAEEGILKGIYKYSESGNKKSKLKVHLFGSGTILNEAIRAQKILEEKYNVSADVWSVTSYKELYMDATSAESVNMLNPDKKIIPLYNSHCCPIRDTKNMHTKSPLCVVFSDGERGKRGVSE